MSNKEILRVNDEDLAEVCGGVKGDGTPDVVPTDEWKKGFFSESGKFCFALIAVPVTAALSTLAVWGTKLLTEYLDKKIAERTAIKSAAAEASKTNPVPVEQF
jgi:hypothetical protein